VVPVSAPRSIESRAQVTIMLVIGCAAGAGSFQHVHDVAAAHGQRGWLAWADAIVLELMSIASGLELRRRKRSHSPTVLPAAVLASAVVLSLGAQVVEAEPSVLGWIAAAIPALGFLVMVKMALQTDVLADSASSGQARPSMQVTGQTVLQHPQEDRLPHPGQELSSRRASRQPNSRPSSGTLSADAAISSLLPTARSASERLDRQGCDLSRRALAKALRAEGHQVSNARAMHLLRVLKAEREASSQDPACA
jgi:hypothetical protein